MNVLAMCKSLSVYYSFNDLKTIHMFAQSYEPALPPPPMVSAQVPSTQLLFKYSFQPSWLSHTCGPCARAGLFSAFGLLYIMGRCGDAGSLSGVVLAL